MNIIGGCTNVNHSHNVCIFAVGPLKLLDAQGAGGWKGWGAGVGVGVERERERERERESGMAGRGCLLVTSAFLVQTSPVPRKHAQAVTDFSVGGLD